MRRTYAALLVIMGVAGLVALVVPAFAEDLVTPAPGQGCCAAGTTNTGDLVYWGSVADKPFDNAAAYSPTEAAVVIDGRFMLNIRASAAGYSVAQRETLVLKRLTELYSACKLGPVVVKPVRGRPTVYVGNVRLITVYPQDVTASKATSAQALAERWAASVRQALLATAPTNCMPRYMLDREASAEAAG